MDRLTELHYKKSNGYYMKCSETCSKDTCGCCDSLWLILQRLGAYEDTGMEPEDILCASDMAKVACALHELNKYKEILGGGCDLDRLRELVEADRDGRCVVFKFGMGSTVYRTWVRPDGKCPFVSAQLIKTVEDLVHAEKWDNAYATREEAEKALRGISENGT